jgi:putative ABC transport system ATP-binding protein
MANICELSNIHKSYGGHPVLQNLHMNIQENEMIAVVGRSGSGKSTLLNIIGLLERPDQGNLKIFDEENPPIYSRRSTKLLREKISYLFQNCALVDNETVNYNLEIPLTYSRKKRKEKQLLKLQALEKVGLKGSLQQKIHELSGGEQQRVAIARIFLKPCELILADEPTGSLDADNRDMVMALIKQLQEEGKTIVVVTHDANVADKCDKIIELE